MNEYEAQLLVVEQALNATDSDDSQRDELLSLKCSLLELLALTRDTETENEAGKSKEPSPQPNEGDNRLNDELERFKNELNDLEHPPQLANDEERRQLEDLRAKYKGMMGEKCSAPHEHSWGAISYHNALICGVDDDVIVNSNGVLDVRLRVLYTNPTHREMLPCTFYLEGECRFDEIRCRYSHGALVSGSSIKNYQPPIFQKLARNCPVLAKLPDRLWHRGRVLCVNFVEQICHVRLDGQEHKERERDFKFEDVFPLTTAESEDEKLSSDEDDSNYNDKSMESDPEYMDDLEAARQARQVELSLFSFKSTERLGAWERYTKGIGSKLMEKMGYIQGTGLGSDGRGIVTPVSAQILPNGRSLDACMQLREAANGDKDYFSVERKLKRAQRRQQAVNEKAYARECLRTDVFAFLNESVFGAASSGCSSGSLDPKKPEAKKSKTHDLEEHSTKTLNVESVRLADDIRRKQRDIAKVKQSLDRNSNDRQLQKRLRAELQNQQDELTSLQAQEHSLSREQQTRKSKSKMFEF